MVTQFEILKKWTENKPHFGGDSFEKWIFTFHLLYSPHFKGKNQLLKSKVQKSHKKRTLERPASAAVLARGSHDETHYKFSEGIKNDRKALELWGFRFWNFTCINVHWMFPNYKFETYSKIGIPHLKEIWRHKIADEAETSRFSTKFNDFFQIMRINDIKNLQLFEKILREFSEKSFDFLSNFFS